MTWGVGGRSTGTIERVTPGTSRWLMTVLLALPKRRSNRRTESIPALSKVASASSGSALNGKACLRDHFSEEQPLAGSLFSLLALPFNFGMQKLCGNLAQRAAAGERTAVHSGLFCVRDCPSRLTR